MDCFYFFVGVFVVSGKDVIVFFFCILVVGFNGIFLVFVEWIWFEIDYVLGVLVFLKINGGKLLCKCYEWKK